MRDVLDPGPSRYPSRNAQSTRADLFARPAGRVGGVAMGTCKARRTSPRSKRRGAQLSPAASRRPGGGRLLGHRCGGRRYLDFLSAYSALNFGHRHPRLIGAAHRQLDRLTLTSRAIHSDQLGPFCAELTDLLGMDRALPMNSGAEAVETAIKTARAWGIETKV